MTKHTLLCYGDSNTKGILADGTVLPYESTWPALTAQLSSQSLDIIAIGQAGLSLSQHPILTERANGFVSLIDALKKHHPNTLVLQLGSNDLKAKFNLSSSAIAQTLSQCLTQIKHCYPKLNIIAICPNRVTPLSNLRNMYVGAFEKSSELQTLFKSCCDNNQVTSIFPEKLFSVAHGDGVHWTKQQHLIMAQALANQIALLPL